MGATLGNLKKKRRTPDVRTIKKHSDIVRSQGTAMIVGGAREKTQYGYIIRGFLGKSFETYFEHMLPKSSTAVYKHDKKDKTVRVLSGFLYVTKEEEGVTTQVKAIAGDEIALLRGTSYRLATSAEEAQLLVCQNAKYDLTVKTVNEKATVANEVSSSLLQEPTMESRIRGIRPQDMPNLRRGSKAKEQLAAARSGRKSPQITELPSGVEVSTSVGKNPRPSQGNFSADGAG